jgi:hypothetical protein
MNRNTVVVSLHYAGLCLPVVKNTQGEDCVPLKPISDLFSLRWNQQREKVTKNPHFAEFLGNL